MAGPQPGGFFGDRIGDRHRRYLIGVEKYSAILVRQPWGSVGAAGVTSTSVNVGVEVTT